MSALTTPASVSVAITVTISVAIAVAVTVAVPITLAWRVAVVAVANTIIVVAAAPVVIRFSSSASFAAIVSASFRGRLRRLRAGETGLAPAPPSALPASLAAALLLSLNVLQLGEVALDRRDRHDATGAKHD
mmetsp:Transcript_26384/g.91759  ORF Transcript_26384/g.91759 Transcript_26384/m.91759 type:complete len:132 (+) Transcript_26384:225-620(+)